MTNKEAIDILMEFNNWRRSEKVTALPMTGKTIGEAIDHAICSLNRLEVDTSEVVMSKKIELLNKITKESAALQQLVSKYNSMERGYGPLYAFENVIAEIWKTSRNIRDGLEGE